MRLGRRPLQRALDSDFFAGLVRYPTPRLEHPCRKIVFYTRSNDQGWRSGDQSAHGSYKDSWTWFEAGLERFEEKRMCELAAAAAAAT